MLARALVPARTVRRLVQLLPLVCTVAARSSLSAAACHSARHSDFSTRRSMSSASAALSGVDLAKSLAAQRAVDEHVRSGMVLGIGSGSTVVFAVQHLVQLVKAGTLKDIKCVPTSFQATQLINEGGLYLSDLSRTPVLDVAIDGADECDAQLNCIKGGGACLLQEKIVASCAKKFIVIADYRKQSARLFEQWKKGLPIEVVPMAYVPVLARLKELGCDASLRMAEKKAGPVVTDNGNFIIDAKLQPDQFSDIAVLEAKLQNIVGIVETGLFVGMANEAYFGLENGTVAVKKVR